MAADAALNDLALALDDIAHSVLLLLSSSFVIDFTLLFFLFLLEM